jgi:2-iminobutanoate/2-iminopropanoate deaminase
VSGQIPIDPKNGKVVQSDIKTQTILIMENAKAILKVSGCDMSKVVKTTIYLKNMSDFGAVNDVYGGYFVSDPPARSTVEVSGLPKNVAVEIDFIAWKG